MNIQSLIITVSVLTLVFSTMAIPPVTAKPYKNPNATRIQQGATPKWINRQLHKPSTHSSRHIGASGMRLQFGGAASSKSTPQTKSSYKDRKTAVRATRKVLRDNAERIAKFLKKNWNKPGARLELPGGKANVVGVGQTGKLAIQGKGLLPAYGAKVIIKRDPNAKLGYSIVNSYPVSPRSFPKQFEKFRATPAGKVRRSFNHKASD